MESDRAAVIIRLTMGFQPPVIGPHAAQAWAVAGVRKTALGKLETGGEPGRSDPLQRQTRAAYTGAVLLAATVSGNLIGRSSMIFS